MMRRWLGVVFVLLSACVVSAQAAFPMTVKAYWNPNPVGDAVTSYTIALDGGVPVPVGTVAINDTNCTLAQYPAGCILAPVMIQAAGQHTFSVIAVNAWGTSAPTVITVNINNPGQIVWVKVTK